MHRTQHMASRGEVRFQLISVSFFVKTSKMTHFGPIWAKFGNFDVKNFLPHVNVGSFLLDQIAGQGLSFLLFWTLAYALVHIY